jgi:hypothetical protein
MKTTDDFLEARKHEGPPKKDVAIDAIRREMFHSPKYKGFVPFKDMEQILADPHWHKLYGKTHLKKAWRELVRDEYVEKVRGHWRWTLGYREP